LRRIPRAMWAMGVITVFLHALVDYPFAHFGITAWIFVLIGALAAVRFERQFEKSNAPGALQFFGPGGRRRDSGKTASFRSLVSSRSKSAISSALVLQMALGGVAGSLASSVANAASPAIAVVSARGAFRVNDATVTGNGTLMEGATIETNRVSSALEWTNG